MLETIATYIEQHQLLPEQGSLIVAVSGGADSLCLLHVLHRLCGPGKRFPGVCLHVAHLNHQLRGADSEHDAQEVARIASVWGLPATIERIDVIALAQQEKRSLEDAARTARYRFLRQVAQGQPIAVAHQQDDQVETLILHWLRGGGIDSTPGLQPRQHDIIRPLLVVTRADTLAYCRQQQLVPQEDASNVDMRFLRNRIRHELLPTLETLNPGIRETLLRSAEVLRVDAEWIEQQVDQHWFQVVTAQYEQTITLSTTRLCALPLSLQRHIIRRATAQLNAGQSPLELRHHQIIEELIQQGPQSSQRTLHMPQQIDALLTGETLVFTRAHERKHVPHIVYHQHAEAMLRIPGQIAVPGTAWLASAAVVEDMQVQKALRNADWETVWRLLQHNNYVVYIDGGLPGDKLVVRTRRPGDRLQPLGMVHEKKVQDILVDRHVPRNERDQIPLFFAHTHCIWLAGIQIAEPVRLTRNTRRLVRLAVHPIS